MSATILKEPAHENDPITDSELPEGWAAVTMGQIAEVIGGGTPSTSDAANFSEDGHAWVTPADLSGFEEIWIKRGNRGLTDKGLRASSATMMPKGTVLMSSRAPIGYVAIAANPISTNQGFKSFVLPPSVIPEYCYYWLKYKKPELEQMGSGSTFLEISGSRAREIPFYIAPTGEQKRIAVKIEELLAQVNAVRAHLTNVAQILKRFRQSVLAAACSGRLTQNWRDTYNPDEWEDLTLSDVIADKPKNGYSARPVKQQTPWKILTLTATTSGSFDARHFKYFDEPIAKDSPFWLRPGDILIQRGNTIEYVGVPAIYDGPPGEFIYPDLMIRLRANNRADTKFLYLALSWEETRKYLRDRATGTAGSMPKINQETLVGVPIKLPSGEEQNEIVRRVEALFKLADEIEKQVSAAAKRADKLTQAILAKAFRGELVPTEAELARREGREYERGSVLLNRIWNERGSSAGAEATNHGSRLKKRLRSKEPSSTRPNGIKSRSFKL